MLSLSEAVTALGASGAVVSATVVGTLYFSNEMPAIESPFSSDSKVNSRRVAFDISDSFFPCRDHISKALPYKVRNVNVDSLSSRYEEGDNTYLVFIDLEVMDRPGTFLSKHSYGAHIACRVSAANNEVTSFQVRKA
jgi:hypothetical protein